MSNHLASILHLADFRVGLIPGCCQSDDSGLTLCLSLAVFFSAYYFCPSLLILTDSSRSFLFVAVAARGSTRPYSRVSWSKGRPIVRPNHRVFNQMFLHSGVSVMWSPCHNRGIRITEEMLPRSRNQMMSHAKKNYITDNPKAPKTHRRVWRTTWKLIATESSKTSAGTHPEVVGVLLEGDVVELDRK